MRSFLARIAAASPLVPALIYTAVAWVATITATLAPAHRLLIALMVLVWIAVTLLFFAVVIWFRDDDWLAAGFLLGMTFALSSMAAEPLAESIAAVSLGPLFLAMPAMMLGVFVRGIISVLLMGGIVALARWITRQLRAAFPSAGAPPAAGKSLPGA